MEESSALPLDSRSLLEAAPDGIAVVDERGKFLVVNAQLCALFGYAPAELTGESVETLVPAHLREGHAGHRGSYALHPGRRPMSLGLDLVGLHRNGSEFPVEVSLSPIDSGGSSFTIAVVRDISERTRMEAERDAMRTLLDTEQERYRIGMDLHDGITQDIYAATLGLDMAYEDVDLDPARAKAEVGRTIEQLQSVIRDIRSYIFDLRPRQFTGDLCLALLDLGREFQENSAIPTEVQVLNGPAPVDHHVGVTLYVIAHEALSNARKYACATSVAISLSARDGALCLDVRDDGGASTSPRTCRRRVEDCAIWPAVPT